MQIFFVADKLEDRESRHKFSKEFHAIQKPPVMKIKFQNEVKDDFYAELRSRVNELLFDQGVYKKRLHLLYFKAVFYYGLFFSCYGHLFNTHYTQLSFLV